DSTRPENAPPMITPTAMSIMLPRRANSLNSWINFFIVFLLFLHLSLLKCRCLPSLSPKQQCLHARPRMHADDGADPSATTVGLCKMFFHFRLKLFGLFPAVCVGNPHISAYGLIPGLLHSFALHF